MPGLTDALQNTGDHIKLQSVRGFLKLSNGLYCVKTDSCLIQSTTMYSAPLIVESTWFILHLKVCIN